MDINEAAAKNNEFAEKPHNVCIVGMGYVGVTLAIALANAGYKILGIENNPQTMEKLQICKPAIYEPELEKIYKRLFCENKISIAEKISPNCCADTFIITIGTPLDENGHSSMLPIRAVSEEIARVLRPGNLVIVRSTVKIGTTVGIVKPCLEKANVPFSLAMCPERTVEGLALAEIGSLPQIIGGIDDASTEAANLFFQPLGVETVRTSSSEAAEFAKLLCNTQRDVYYAFSNEAAILAENLGLDAHEVIAAANYKYHRAEIARPGPVGGPCLEKDGFILAESLKKEDDACPSLVLTSRVLHVDIIAKAVQRVKLHLEEKLPKKIVIMGLAFKGMPETGDIRGSLAIPLVRQLHETFPDAILTGFDPVATLEESNRWNLPAIKDVKLALTNADVIFIQTNHKMFRSAEFANMIDNFSPDALVYDFWRCINPDFAKSHPNSYLVFGVGTNRKV